MTEIDEIAVEMLNAIKESDRWCKPVPKPDSKHPSSKADPSGDEPQPRMKSTITKPKQPSETQEKDSSKKKENAEKKVLQDKPNRWIEAHVKCLDPGGYLDKVKSLRYFESNACEFAMGIVAIADWGRRYLDKGLKYPIPTIPPYLFTPLPEACQSGAQVPVRPSQLGGPGGDVCHHSRESWKWLATVLQFWMDEATVADGAVYGGHVRPASAPCTVCNGHSKSGFGTRIQGILGGRNHLDAMAD